LGNDNHTKIIGKRLKIGLEAEIYAKITACCQGKSSRHPGRLHVKIGLFPTVSGWWARFAIKTRKTGTGEGNIET
jgi:hypothetical protein